MHTHAALHILTTETMEYSLESAFLVHFTVSSSRSKTTGSHQSTNTQQIGYMGIAAFLSGVAICPGQTRPTGTRVTDSPTPMLGKPM